MMAWLRQVWRELTVPAFDRLDTIDLYGDLDEVELLMAVEEEFDITIFDEIAENCISMGDLFDVVLCLIDADQDSDDLWKRLCKIARSFTPSRHPFTRDTTFFAAYATKRSC